MGKASPSLGNWNAGELSPDMEGRTDIDKYAVGCHTLTNFIPMVQGPAKHRPGSRYLTGVKTSANRTWMREFEFSTTQAFQVEFGDQYLRFYTNHGQIQASPAAYNGGTTYAKGQVVSNAGTNYVCIKITTGNAPPNATYWYAITGTIYEIPTPYAVADLTNTQGAFAFQMVQSADVLYIAGNKKYPPYALTRFGDTQWSLDLYFPQDGPFLNQNTAAQALYLGTAASSATYGPNSFNVVATAPVFASTDTSAGGAYAQNRLLRMDVQNFATTPWTGNTAYTLGKLIRFNGNTYKALNAATSGASPPVHIAGAALDGNGGVLWQYQDSGYGIGQIVNVTDSKHAIVQAMSGTQWPADVFGTVYTITAISQANPCVVTSANALAVGDTVFITGVVGMSQITEQSFIVTAVTGANFTLGSVDSTTYSAYTSGGSAIKNATMRYQLGAWSQTTEYPSAVTFHDDRLFWGGALRLWGSVPGLYTSYAQDFNDQVTTDSAISVVLSAGKVSQIVWLKSANILLIGTDGGEFGLGPLTQAQPLGPANVHIVPQSVNKCRAIKAQKIITSVFYVQRAARKVLAMDYNFYLDKYDSTNQNRMAYHITKSGIVDWAWHEQPYQVLWCALTDGTLVGYTFDREDNVTGWHRHSLGGSGFVESVSVTPSPDGLRDELWLVVKRTINGATVRFIEYLEKDFERGDLQSSAFYSDAGATYSGAPATVISGLGYLEGQTVQVIADGAATADKVVTGGSITLDLAASVVQVGLYSTAILVPMRIDAGADVGPSSQGKLKRVPEMTIRFIDTLGGWFGMDGQTLDEISFRDPSVPMGSPPPIFSGDKLVNVTSTYESDCRPRIEQRQPFPMTVAALYPYLEANEPL